MELTLNNSFVSLNEQELYGVVSGSWPGEGVIKALKEIRKLFFRISTASHCTCCYR